MTAITTYKYNTIIYVLTLVPTVNSVFFRILNRVVNKVIFWAVLAPKTLIIFEKMLKNEWYTFKYLNVDHLNHV